MTHKEILATVDHTLLAQTATWEEIKVICDDGAKYHTASVCIPPCYVTVSYTHLDVYKRQVQHLPSQLKQGRLKLQRPDQQY